MLENINNPNRDLKWENIAITVIFVLIIFPKVRIYNTLLKMLSTIIIKGKFLKCSDIDIDIKEIV